MAEQKIYFQWQNEVLEKTIYPLRRMNLRNTLEYYMEIDLWAQYKNRKLTDLAADITAYHERKKLVIARALKDYKDTLAYFMQDYVPVVSPEKPVDAETLKKLTELHAVFKTYYDRIRDARKESYFISQRFDALEKSRVQLEKDIVLQARRLNAIKTNNPNHRVIPEETKKLELLQNARPLMETERFKIKELISAHEKLANANWNLPKKWKRLSSNKRKPRPACCRSGGASKCRRQN